MSNPQRSIPATRATWFVLAAILAVAVTLRVAWFQELKESPDYESPTADAAFHDYWARGMVTGDWTPPEGEGDPRLRDVPFLRPPGYSYFLAAVYKVAGLSFSAPRIVQFGLGVGNVLLLFVLASAMFDRPTGLVASFLGATYWGLAYFEGQLQAPVLIITLILVFLRAMQFWAVSKKAIPAVVGGVVLGLLVLVSANALLLIPVVMFWMWRTARSTRPGRARAIPSAAMFAVGALIAISPATIRNLVTADDFVLVSCNGAINLHIGNNEESDGVTARIPRLQELTGTSRWSWFTYDRIVQGVWKEEGRQLRYSEVSSYFTQKAIEFIASNPTHFLALSAKRAAMFWGPDEISNNKAIGVEKASSSVLRYLPPFSVVVSLAFAGLILHLADRRGGGGRKRGRKQVDPIDPMMVLTILVLLTWFLSYVPFLAAGRFRLPVVPLLLLFAAYGLTSGYRHLLHRVWGRLLVLPAGWLLLFLVFNTSIAGDEVDVAWWHTDRAVAHMREGQVAEAEIEFRAALAANPGYVDAKTNYAMLLSMTDRIPEAIDQYRSVAANRPDRFDVRIRLAGLLTTEGRSAEAITEMREVVRLAPNEPEAHFELGRALVDRKSYRDGVSALEECLRLKPDYGAAHANLGAALSGIGDPKGAVAEYMKAAQQAPESAEIRYHLGNALMAVGDLMGAENSFREAIRLSPEYVEPVIHLGMVFNKARRPEAAIEQFRRAIAMDRRNMTARCNLGGSLANLGRYEDAIEALEEALSIEPGHKIAGDRLRIVKELKAQQGR